MTDSPGVLDLPCRRIGGIPFRVALLTEAVASVLASAEEVPRSGVGVGIHFANAYTIALARHHPRYAALLSDPSGAVFTDGVPVAWVGRRAFPGLAPRWGRVYGPDVMEAVLAASTPASGPRHYLLGGSPGSLQALRTTIANRWPAATIVGAESPPYRSLTHEELTARETRIRESGASIVWVGLGTPKQDWEAARLAAAIPVVTLAVGAAFDFLAGAKPQAPPWMQQSGTEWAFRLASEPRRLSRRYMWGNPRFLVAVARQPGLRRGAGEREVEPTR